MGMQHLGWIWVLALLFAGCPKGQDDDAGDDDAGDDDAGDDDAGDDDAGDDDAGDDDSGPAARWSFLVFMNGDNDLESMVVPDLNELEQVGSGNGVHVLVQADRHPGYDTSDGDWTGCRRYRIEGDADPQQVSSPVLEELGECDMGDPATLAEFLLWAHAAYPAERIALVMWDHGDSWTVRAEEPPARSDFVSWDETSDTWLSIAEGDLRAGLAPLVSARGPLEVIGFDACLMGSWEVAHSLRDQVEVMCGSETTVGMEGYVYPPVLALMRDEDADPGASEVGIALAHSMVDPGGEWIHIAVDTAGMDDLAVAVDAVAGAALDDPAKMDALLEARDDAGGADSSYPLWYLDLYDLGRELSQGGEPTLAAAGQDVMDAIDAATLGQWANPPYQWAGGLSIYFDPWPGYMQPYCFGAGATWAEETRWDELILQLGAN